MPTVRAAPPPEDNRVPALAVLLGPDGVDAVQAAMAGSGHQVEEARASQVRYSPGKSVVVQFTTKMRDSDGKSSEPMVVATSGIQVPEGTLRVESGDLQIAVWRFPDDPFLPGLPLAMDARRASELLDRLGATNDGVSLRARAYRASRRAVVEATGAGGTIYMKVLRRRRIGALQMRHVHLVDHLPIPRSLGWSERHGIVAMQALGGRTLRRCLEGGELELPSPESLVALLDAFPPPHPDMTRVASPIERAPDHARLLRKLLPEEGRKLSSIVDRVAQDPTDEAPVAVHGDFHSSQVLVGSGRIVGLVDVDTAGIGQRADDLAGLIGQLATLALDSPQPGAIAAYNELLVEHFTDQNHPESLRRRVAAVILGLATGPFRVQLPEWPEATSTRLDLALRWLESAGSEEIPVTP